MILRAITPIEIKTNKLMSKNNQRNSFRVLSTLSSEVETTTVPRPEGKIRAIARTSESCSSILIVKGFP